MLSGQYSNPIRVAAFNTAERWSEDSSEDGAREYAAAAFAARDRYVTAGRPKLGCT